MNDETFQINWITEKEIHFTNKKRITYNHIRDCCEHNYADFKQVEDIALEYEFTEPLQFEIIENYGFRFGNKGKIDIYYDEKCVLSDCHTEIRRDWY